MRDVPHDCRHISEVKVGDQVRAADPETGVQGARVVTDVLVDTVVELATADDATVTTTADHPSTTQPATNGSAPTNSAARTICAAT